MHSSPFRLIVFGTFLSTSLLQAGLQDLTILVSPDGKQYVILAGDNHLLSPGSQTERLAAAVAECQKNDASHMEIYLEKPATLFTRNDGNYILTDLGPNLQKLNVPRISMTNCEIRNVSALILWFLHNKYPELIDPQASFECGGKNCIAGYTTLQDLDLEFRELHFSLSEFTKQQSEPLKIRIQSHLDLARKQMEFFHKKIELHTANSGNLLQTAIAVAAYDKKNPEERLQAKLSHSVFDAFSRLFNMNMVREIFSSKHRKQLFLAGLLHTRIIRSFLFNYGWTLDPRYKTDQTAQKPESITFTAITQIKTTHEE